MFQPTQPAVSPLRRRMLEDMAMRAPVQSAIFRPELSGGHVDGLGDVSPSGAPI